MFFYLCNFIFLQNLSSETTWFTFYDTIKVLQGETVKFPFCKLHPTSSRLTSSLLWPSLLIKCSSPFYWQFVVHLLKQDLPLLERGDATLFQNTNHQVQLISTLIRGVNWTRTRMLINVWFDRRRNLLLDCAVHRHYPQATFPHVKVRIYNLLHFSDRLSSS